MYDTDTTSKNTFFCKEMYIDIILTTIVCRYDRISKITETIHFGCKGSFYDLLMFLNITFG